ncbi:hypothetical protein [Halorussus salinisoli]|uniref:hypothetical protein n=1 Tax=Halorussus salinisoli TaxID=2558242 RepID=UPI0010C200A3|nr:hypothetical protein [Halorussus salinisoli]
MTNSTFALAIGTAWLVMPLMAVAGRTMDGPRAHFVLAAAAAVALEAPGFEVETGTHWRFGGTAFLVGTVVHLCAGTGANSGEASVPVVVGVWVHSVGVFGVE